MGIIKRTRDKQPTEEKKIELNEINSEGGKDLIFPYSKKDLTTVFRGTGEEVDPIIPQYEGMTKMHNTLKKSIQALIREMGLSNITVLQEYCTLLNLCYTHHLSIFNSLKDDPLVDLHHIDKKYLLRKKLGYQRYDAKKLLSALSSDIKKLSENNESLNTGIQAVTYLTDEKVAKVVTILEAIYSEGEHLKKLKANQKEKILSECSTLCQLRGCYKDTTTIGIDKQIDALTQAFDIDFSRIYALSHSNIHKDLGEVDKAELKQLQERILKGIL